MRKTSKAAAAPSGSPIRARDDRGTMHYVLLLRGVNVGTKNSLPMVELREMLTKLGCSGARTYVQSGNAVFGTKLDTDALTNAVEAALERKMGRPIATTLRTHEQLQGGLRALDIHLDEAALARLDEIFPGHKPAPEDYAW